MRIETAICERQQKNGYNVNADEKNVTSKENDN